MRRKQRLQRVPQRGGSQRPPRVDRWRVDPRPHARFPSSSLEEMRDRRYKQRSRFRTIDLCREEGRETALGVTTEQQRGEERTVRRRTMHACGLDGAGLCGRGPAAGRTTVASCLTSDDCAPQPPPPAASKRPQRCARFKKKRAKRRRKEKRCATSGIDVQGP